MGEIIEIHVGQAGVQIANACWELYCLEHGIGADGSVCESSCDRTFRNFFDIKSKNKVVPRAVLVDSEPTVVDQVRTGPYGHLYTPTGLITGKEDSGSNFARGYYTMGAELIDVTMEAIRNVAESCCNLTGFITFRSIGGGTGSGLGTLIAEQLQEEYEKVNKLEFIVFPSPSMSPLIVEPYNALLATHFGMDALDCTFIVDNEALYDICAAKLNIIAPKYKNLNRIIGQIASTFTTSQRFAGNSNVSISEFQTNLVPYPRIHYPIVSYAPFVSGTGTGYTNFTTEQLTYSCFEPSSQLVRCNPAEGKYMSCVLLYRGKFLMTDINESISHLRSTQTVRFVDWAPTGFKIGMNTRVPFSVPGGGLGKTSKALLSLSNNTIIEKAWCRLIGKFNILNSRRAFLHHYLAEGMEEDAFKEASDNICTLLSDYHEAGSGGSSGSFSGERISQGDKVKMGQDRLEYLSRMEQSTKKKDACSLACRCSCTMSNSSSSTSVPTSTKSPTNPARFSHNNPAVYSIHVKSPVSLRNRSSAVTPTKSSVISLARNPLGYGVKPSLNVPLRDLCSRHTIKDDLPLRALPGLASLNYFFGYSHFQPDKSKTDAFLYRGESLRFADGGETARKSKKMTCDVHCQTVEDDVPYAGATERRSRNNHYQANNNSNSEKPSKSSINFREPNAMQEAGICSIKCQCECHVVGQSPSQEEEPRYNDYEPAKPENVHWNEGNVDKSSTPKLYGNSQEATTRQGEWMCSSECHCQCHPVGQSSPPEGEPTNNDYKPPKPENILKNQENLGTETVNKSSTPKSYTNSQEASARQEEGMCSSECHCQCHPVGQSSPPEAIIIQPTNAGYKPAKPENVHWNQGNLGAETVKNGSTPKSHTNSQEATARQEEWMCSSESHCQCHPVGQSSPPEATIIQTTNNDYKPSKPENILKNQKNLGTETVNNNKTPNSYTDSQKVTTPVGQSLDEPSAYKDFKHFQPENSQENVQIDRIIRLETKRLTYECQCQGYSVGLSPEDDEHHACATTMQPRNNDYKPEKNHWNQETFQTERKQGPQTYQYEFGCECYPEEESPYHEKAPKLRGIRRESPQVQQVPKPITQPVPESTIALTNSQSDYNGFSEFAPSVRTEFKNTDSELSPAERPKKSKSENCLLKKLAQTASWVKARLSKSEVTINKQQSRNNDQQQSKAGDLGSSKPSLEEDTRKKEAFQKDTLKKDQKVRTNHEYITQKPRICTKCPCQCPIKDENADTHQKQTPQKDKPQSSIPKRDTTQKETPERDTPQRDTVLMDTLQKDTLQKSMQQKDTPQKATVSKDTNQKATLRKEMYQETREEDQKAIQQKDTQQKDTQQKHTRQEDLQVNQVHVTQKPKICTKCPCQCPIEDKSPQPVKESAPITKPTVTANERAEPVPNKNATETPKSIPVTPITETKDRLPQQPDSRYQLKLSLPTRSWEILEQDLLPTPAVVPKKSETIIPVKEKSETAVPAKKKSEPIIPTTKAEPTLPPKTPKTDECPSNWSNEPECVKTPAKPKPREKFDQGLDTEGVRAKERYFRSHSTDCHCCRERKLAPRRTEGKETLGEAQLAKERFCYSTCGKSREKRPPMGCKSLPAEDNYYREAHIDNVATSCCQEKHPLPIDTSCEEKAPCSLVQQIDYDYNGDVETCDEKEKYHLCFPQIDYTCEKEKPPCCCDKTIQTDIQGCHPPPPPPPNHNQQSHGLCLSDSDQLITFNSSDNRLVPMCCRPSRLEWPHPITGFYNNEMDSMFSSSSALLPPQMPYYIYQEEQMLFCHGEDRICECYPERNAMTCPEICPRAPNTPDQCAHCPYCNTRLHNRC